MRRKTETSGSDLLFSVPWLHENEVSLHQSITKAREAKRVDKSGEPSQKPVTVAMIADPSPWNLIVVLLSSVDQGADAATSLDKNENDDKQENREM